MIDCLLLGDQVADGLRDYISGCVPLTVQQVTSYDYIKMFDRNTLINGEEWTTVIISLGVNDNPDGRHTKTWLRDLRHRIKADQVFWILPPELVMELRSAVHDVALAKNDGLIDVVGWQKNLMPSQWGYREIADKLNK